MNSENTLDDVSNLDEDANIVSICFNLIKFTIFKLTILNFVYL